MALFGKKGTETELKLPEVLPEHVGFIMDGNGRWAKKRGLPRSFGHREGAKNFKKIVRYCKDIGLKNISFYAFSTENWQRPADEVNTIMELFRDYIVDVRNFLSENTRMIFLGDKSAFDEDLHVAAVGGEVAIIQLAKDLKEEKSKSISASADFYHRFGPVQLNLLVEGFYTDLSDVFFLQEKGHDDQGNLIMERRNKDGARVMGVNLEGKMAYTWLQLQAGATIQRSRYKEAVTWSETNPDLPAQKKMFRTPDVYGYFTSTFTPVKRLAVSLTGTYTGTMLVQHLAGYIPEDREEKTPDFFDLNMKVAYDFPLYKSVTLQVNAGVQNILEAYQSDFDQGKDRDSKYIYGPGMPRSYFVGCKISY